MERVFGRGRFTTLKLEEGDMHEYCFYVNYGGSNGAVMDALAHAGGGARPSAHW